MSSGNQCPTTSAALFQIVRDVRACTRDVDLAMVVQYTFATLDVDTLHYRRQPLMMKRDSAAWLGRARVWLALSLFVVALAGTGCASPTPTPTPTATPLPTPTNTPKPTLTPTPVPQPLELVVLFSNDTMGYTEPCG
jgi:hypothetical protein